MRGRLGNPGNDSEEITLVKVQVLATTQSGYFGAAPNRYAKFPEAGDLRLEEIQQHHIRVALHSFEDNFTTVRRDVKVANVEV